MVVGKSHPDLYSCLTELQKEQGNTEMELLELNLGRNVKAAPKEKWISVQVRLRRLAREYENYKSNDELMKYLE